MKEKSTVIGQSFLSKTNQQAIFYKERFLRILLILGVGLLTGCSDLEYAQTKIGELKGRLVIEWINSDTFRFLKHPKDPLRFTRFDGTTIIPGTMVTDGGSIPVALRAVKTYSPWGFGPAFVIHDWLFQMKSCKLPGYEKLTFEQSADIMAEIIKTMMESKKYGAPDKWTLYSMHKAVQSSYAKEMWDNGVCVPVPSANAKAAPPKPAANYSGDKAMYYKRKMETVKKAAAASPQFRFEKSY